MTRSATLVCANGVYDILCALGILLVPNTGIAQLHTSMFSLPLDPLARRMLAYWLITYGAIRVAAMSRNKTLHSLVVMTYLLEAAAFAAEHLVHDTAHWQKVAFVSTSCICIAYYYLSECTYPWRVGTCLF
jgi:predicted benzoate:H+ symporter BenE